MQIKERDALIHIVCRYRDCDNCPIRNDCDKRFVDMAERRIISVARNLFRTKESAFMKSIKYLRKEAPNIYDVFMKYVSGVKYD